MAFNIQNAIHYCHQQNYNQLAHKIRSYRKLNFYAKYTKTIDIYANTLHIQKQELYITAHIMLVKFTTINRRCIFNIRNIVKYCRELRLIVKNSDGLNI